MKIDFDILQDSNSQIAVLLNPPRCYNRTELKFLQFYS